MTENSDPPPPPPEPPAAPPAPDPTATPIPPPGDFSGFPPPPGPSKIAGLGKFTAGCLLTLALGAGMFIAIFDNTHRAMGCAAVQLVYVIPAVFLLLRKRQPAWAFGIVFGGAIVVLLASMCGDMNFH